jgi:chemotaxis protein MotB
VSARARRRGGHDGGGGGGHDGAGMMRWLLTYADMITLLLVFFIVLYALSKINEARYKSLMQALRAALTGRSVSSVGRTHSLAKYNPPNVRPSPNNNAFPPRPPAAAQDNLVAALRRAVARDHLQGQISVAIVPQGVLVEIHSGVLFPSAQATIQPTAARILTDVGKVLAAVPNQVVVQGFTDDKPIHNAQFYSNWDLSAARAARVVDYWTGEGLNPTRFLVEGFGQYSPTATNATAAGRAQNRRVDIVVLKNPVVPDTTLVIGQG